MESRELMTIEQIVNTLGTSIILWYFLAPTILVTLTIYAVRRYKFKKMLRESKKQQKQQVTINEKTSIKENTLYLEFDKRGKIKNKLKK